jgi:outer membrane protein assembly factor BamB
MESAAIPLDGQAGATAAIVGDRAYVGLMTDEVVGIDLGKKIVEWRYAPKGEQPFYASAAVTDSLVIVGSRDRLMHAIDRKTGDAQWTFPTKGRIDSSPVVVGKRVYFGSADGNLYVLDRDSGNLVQKLALGKGILGAPAVSDGRLVIGTTDNWVVCLGKK